MAEFEVSFTKSQRELSELILYIEQAGEELDHFSAAGDRAGNRYAKSVERTERVVQRLNKRLNKLTSDTEQVAKATDAVRQQSQKFLASIAKGNQKADQEIMALKASTDELGRAFQEQLAKETYSKWLKKTASEAANLRGQNEFLQKSIKDFDNPIRQTNLQLQAMHSHLQRVSTAEQKQRLSARELQQQLQLNSSSQGAYNATLQERIRGVNQANTADERQRNKLAELMREYQSLHGGMGENIAQQRALNQARSQEVTADTRLIAEVEKLERQVREYNTSLHASKASLEETLRQKRELAVQQQREQADLDKLQRKLTELNEGGYARQRLQITEQIAAKQRLLVENEREQQTLEKLQRELAELESARGREIASTRQTIAAKKQEITETQRQADEKAKLERSLRSLIDGEEREIAVLKERTQAQRRAVTADERRENQVKELRRELEYLNSAQGREYIQLQQNVAAQRKALQARHRNNASMRVGNQLTASMRAGLAGLHTSFGMYTSSTIAAATATYAFAAAIRDTVGAGMEFTESMSRAEAIMFSSADAAGSSASQMRALEMQVRALGQSTVFTATEVSGGLIDLAMAGLSGGEALTALKPSLDLASIGMISMSESADIATNVMTAFKKDAGDLQDVVNVMATAVTNSNTNIQQLANSLSYVGPAADSAGFSMRDTVAAIELLASSGIKGSKAGTGLRRTMLNLLNPTTKGRAVLDKYNIAVLNADGSTRNLTDIMGQFGEALYNDAITPAERTAAIVDLVGVRAQSAFARMASSAGELTVLREQLDNVAGAAERMREKIEDNLTADWKQVKSAFEEIELTVFENFESQLRALSAATTVWLHDLNDVAEVIGRFDKVDGFQVIDPANPGEMVDVTQLDVILARIEMLAEAVPSLLGAFAAFTGSKVLKSFSNDMGAASGSLVRFQQRTEASAMAARSYASAVASASGPTTGMVTKLQLMAGASHYAARALNVAAVAAGGLATAGRVLTAAMGWVGIAYSAYTALQTLFGRDVAEKITDQKNRVLEAKEAYEGYQEVITQTQEDLNREALGARLEELDSQLDATREKLTAYSSALASVSEAAHPEVYETLLHRLTGLRMRMGELGEETSNTREAMGQLGTSSAEVQRLSDSQDSLVASIVAVNERLEEAKRWQEENSVATGASTREIERNQQVVATLTEAHRLFASALVVTSDELDKATEALSGWTEQFDAYVDAKNQEYLDDRLSEELTLREKIAKTTQREAELRERVAKAEEASRNGSGGPGAANAALAEAQKAYDEVHEQRIKLLKEERELTAENTELRQAWVFQQMAETEQLKAYRSELSVVEDRLAEQQTLRRKSAHDVEVENELLKRREELQRDISSIEDRAAKDRKKDSVDYTRELERQSSLLAEIAQTYADYDQYVARERELLAVESARADLLYGTNLSMAERARLAEKAYSIQQSFVGVLDDINQRSEQIAANEQRINELKQRAITLSGEKRKDAEDGVAEALQRQSELVKDQVADYQQLLDASLERTRELNGSINEVRQQEEITRLINEAAAAGKLLEESDAERIVTLRKQRQEQKRLNKEIEALREEMQGLSGEDLAYHQQVLEQKEAQRDKQEEWIRLLQQERTEISANAQALINQADAVEQFFSDTGDAVYDTLRDGFDDVDGMFDSIEESFKDLLAKMAYEAFINPIIVGVQNDMMGSMGLGSGAGGSAPGAGGRSGINLNANTLQKGWDTVSGWISGGGSNAGGIYNNVAATQTGTLYGSAATGASQGGLYGNAVTGGVSSGSSLGWTSYGSGGGYGTSLANMGAGMVASYAGGYIGSEVGESVTGKTANSNIGQTAGSLIGSIWGPIGTGVGAAIGSFVDSLFGSEKAPPEFEYEQRDFAPEEYEFGGRDTPFSSTGTFGFDISRLNDESQQALDQFATALQTADKALAGFMDDGQIERVKEAMDEFAYTGLSNADLLADRLDVILEAAGMQGELYDRMREDYQGEEMSAKRYEAALNIAQLEDLLTRVPDNVANHVDKRLKQNDVVIGELSESLIIQIQQWETLGGQIENLVPTFDMLAEGAVDVTNALHDAAGGMENLQALQSSYYQNFFTEAEQQRHLQQQLTQQFAALNMQLPASRGEFRSIVESLDLTTDSGREAYLAMLNLSDSFAQLTSSGQGASALGYAANASISDAVSAYQDVMSASRELAEERRQQLEDEKKAVEQLGSLLDSLLLSSQSILSPAERLQEAQRQFAELQVKAEMGDTEAVGQLKGASSSYLDAAASYYGQASSQYASIFNDVTGSVEDLEGQFASSVDALGSIESIDRMLLREQQRARDTLNRTLDEQIQANQSLSSLTALLEVLPSDLSNALRGILETGTTPNGNEYIVGGNDAEGDPLLSGSSGAVSDAFRDILGRDPDDSGLDYYQGQLDSGQMTIDEIRRRMADSDEANNRFATGGVFTNGIVERPTTFPMGLMGEAGPEAVMPLSNAGGKLGVNVSGAVDIKPLVAEVQALRQEVSKLRAERARDAQVATQQRGDQVSEMRRGNRRKQPRGAMV